MTPEAAGGARPRGRPPMTGEQRHRVRLQISRAAVRLFRARGVAATSGEQIAAACGLSTRSLWRHVGSKEACVEPLLTQSVDAFTASVASWPPDRSLAEHLALDYRLPPDASGADVEAVFDIVRMTRDEPGLRAVWLLVHQRAEPAFAAAIAARAGLPADALEVRVQAATLNAAVRVAAEDLARGAPRGPVVGDDIGPGVGDDVAAAPPGTVTAYRTVLATAVRVAGHGLGEARGSG